VSAERVALSLHAHDDEADAAPIVEPLMQRHHCTGTRRVAVETKGRKKDRPTGISGNHPSAS
jgi:hypothetical protein